MNNPTTPIVDVEVLSSTAAPGLSSDQLADLRRAQTLLTSPGPAIRFANLIGSPIEKAIALLPASATALIQSATRAALDRALRVALHSLDTDSSSPPEAPDNRFHKFLVGASGAVGGAFGLGSVVVELPISTTLILRSIAQIAASQGHDLRDLRNRLACLEVFALGGDTSTDRAADTSYWAVRAALAQVVTEAATSLAGRAAGSTATPAAVGLLRALAARFGVIVSEQVAAKAVPIVGAATGAAINVVFMDHFQRMAEGHFIIRRLEQQHGAEATRAAWRSMLPPHPPR